jgi:hypothetical protein
MKAPEPRSTVANAIDVIVAARIVSTQVRLATAEAYRQILECRTSIRQANILLDQARQPYPARSSPMAESQVNPIRR